VPPGRLEESEQTNMRTIISASHVITQYGRYISDIAGLLETDTSRRSAVPMFKGAPSDKLGGSENPLMPCARHILQLMENVAAMIHEHLRYFGNAT
jgi:hypothetical protein